MRSCEYIECREDIKSRDKRAKFCSRECFYLERKRIAEANRRTHCEYCNVSFVPERHNGKFCSQSCSAKKSNAGINRHRNRTSKNLLNSCLLCFSPVRNKYCSNICRYGYQAKQLEDWLLGLSSHPDNKGLRPDYRQAFLDLHGTACQECGWDKPNPHSGRFITQVDHIDGNRSNNDLSNLRILCPTCHAMTPTFGHLNRTKKSSTDN